MHILVFFRKPLQGQILLHGFEFNFLAFGIDSKSGTQLLDPVYRLVYLDHISLSVRFFILILTNTFKVWIEIFAEKLGDVAGLGQFPNGNSLLGLGSSQSS